MTVIHGVISGVDGTLIDSNDAYANAWVDVLHNFGYTITFARVRHLIGMGGANPLPTAIRVEEESSHTRTPVL